MLVIVSQRRQHDQSSSVRSFFDASEDDTHDAAASDDEKPNLEVANATTPSGPSPTLSGGFAKPGTNDETDHTDNGEKEEAINHTRALVLSQWRE